MKGLEPSTFAMARRRSSQLSYIRRMPSIAQPVMARSRRPARAGAPTEVPHARHRRHLQAARTRSRRRSRTAIWPCARPSPARCSPASRRTDAAGTDAAVARAAEAFETWRDVPGAAPRRARAPARRGAAAREGGARRARHARDRQDRPGGPRRGAGDDRHLRPRRGPLAPALRPHDRLRAARAPHARDVAPARPRRRHHRVQLPGRRVGWNSALALVCGDPVVWKPSERTPLTALACQALFRRAAAAFGDAPGRAARGRDRRRRPRARSWPRIPRLPLVSATGSTVMGKAVSPLIAARLGPLAARARRQQRHGRRADADLDLAVRAVVFSAVGTAGQRCTSLRRLIVHESIADELSGRLERAYATVPVGDPREPGTLCGPLISRGLVPPPAGGARARARRRRQRQRRRARAGRRASRRLLRPPRRSCACRRRPSVVREETFAPILYVLTLQRPRRGRRAAQRRAAGALVVHLHDRPARGASASSRRPAATAASPTSTSARAAPRSAAPSAARRTPAAGASPAPTRGGPTCAARPPRSTARASCRSRRASSSTSAERRQASQRVYSAALRSGCGGNGSPGQPRCTTPIRRTLRGHVQQTRHDRPREHAGRAPEAREAARARGQHEVLDRAGGGGVVLLRHLRVGIALDADDDRGVRAQQLLVTRGLGQRRSASPARRPRSARAR